jgi:hypothetical protein
MTSVREAKINNPGERYHRASLIAASAFINHASWNMSLPRFISRQLSRRTFRSFVIANLRGNEIGSLPYLYRHHNGTG